MSGFFPSQTSSTATTTSGAPSGDLARLGFEALSDVRTDIPENLRFGGAPANPLQFSGVDQRADALKAFGPGFGSEILKLARQFSNPTSNTLLPETIDAAVRPVTENLSNARLNLASGAEQFGATGGARAALADTQLVRDANTRIGDIASSLAFGSREADLGRAERSPGLFQAGFGLSQLPGAATSALGSELRGLESVEENERLARFNAEQSAPFAGLNQLAAILSGLPFGSSTTSTSQLDQMTQLLQFLLGAGALGVGGASLFGGGGGGGGALPGPVFPF